MSLRIKFKAPGRYLSTENQHLRSLFIIAVRQGASQALDSYLQTVAKKTGTLRSSLYIGIMNQLYSNSLSSVITIRFPYNLLGSYPSYAKYHIIGFDLNIYFNKVFYKKPTTAGTRPINPTECMKWLLRGIIQALQSYLNINQLNFNQLIQIEGTA